MYTSCQMSPGMLGCDLSGYFVANFASALQIILSAQRYTKAFACVYICIYEYIYIYIYIL